MTKLYCARWVLPICSPPIDGGALAIAGEQIVGVGSRSAMTEKFPDATVRNFGDAIILPGLVNAHSHLELTAMRGFLENEESDCFLRAEKINHRSHGTMTADDLLVSAAWGACEAARAGVTCLADASDSAFESMNALREVGLRGIVFQESFGPDSRLAEENFEKLKTKVARLRDRETSLVKCGVSPHAPYTVSAPQLEMIANFASSERLPVMMHAAETQMEVSLLREGKGAFAEGLRKRGIEWQAPGVASIHYLQRHGILQTRPCWPIAFTSTRRTWKILNRPNARGPWSQVKRKLGHGRAPSE